MFGPGPEVPLHGLHRTPRLYKRLKRTHGPKGEKRMTPTMLTDLLKSLSLLSVALLLGTLLRAKLRFLQATFMPASVIGGVILLIAGPQVLGITDRNLINKTIAHEARQRFLKTLCPKCFVLQLSLSPSLQFHLALP